MAYADVEFLYGAVVRSADLNQLAENDRVADEFISERRALPHVRVRLAGGNLGSGGAWVTCLLNTTPADGGTSVAPVTLTSTGATITRDGLYRFEAVVSASGSDFAIRLRNTNPEPDTTLAQSPIGTSVSLTNNLSTTRRLITGDVIAVQVYKVTAGSVTVDAADTPSYLAITRESD